MTGKVTEMATCAARTTKGQPCQGQAINGSRFCFAHDPASGQARALARKRGGQRRRVGHAADASKLPGQVRSAADVLKVLDYALAEVLPLENSVQRGRLIISIAGAFDEAIKTGELETRVAALEKLLSERNEQ